MARKTSKKFFKSSRPSKQALDPEFQFTRRALVAGGTAGALWLGLIGRFYQLQILNGDEYRRFAEENRIRLDLAPPQRGQILDRF